MEPDSLVQLVGSGNTSSIEEEWMKLVGGPDTTSEMLLPYDVVLSAFLERQNTEQAESFASTAIEALAERQSPKEAITVAGPYLRAVGDSKDLRKQVAELYRAAYAGFEGLDALLAEAGLEAGRPVRRALRTMDVCLTLEVGDYLVERHDDGAAQVESIDRTDWSYTINLGRKSEEIGGVCLADDYMKSSGDDFRVMRRFSKEELVARTKKEPASVVIELCRINGNKIDSLDLERTLVPGIVGVADWKKWWTRARTGLKKHANVTIEGRSPYYLTYRDVAASPDVAVLEDLKRLSDPAKEIVRVELFLRECKDAGITPEPETLTSMYATLEMRAKRIGKSAVADGALRWAVVARLHQLVGKEGVPEGAIKCLTGAERFAASFDLLDSTSLISAMFDCAVVSHGDDWQEQFLEILPNMAWAGCDFIATKLVEAGRDASDFEPVVAKILASPLSHFEALLWLWNGPTNSDVVPVPALRTLMSKILRTFEQSGRMDGVEAVVVRKMGGRARSVLSARKCERFKQCLEELDAGLAGAMRRQMVRCDALGRAVREDLLRLLNAKYEPVVVTVTTEPWEQEDILYVTAYGMRKKQEEIEHHLNVKMRDNARAIGAAAEHGDLSENSEYKFALEERDLLRARLGQMNDEMSSAEVMKTESVPTEHVGVGSKVVFKGVKSGEEYQMVFLGPWEADVPNGVLNYKTPLAQRIMGRHVGDELEFDHTGAKGTFEIVSIINSQAD